MGKEYHNLGSVLLLSVFSVIAYGTHATSPLADALHFIGDEARQDKYVHELLELARIPSVSAQPERLPDVERAATWVVTRLKTAGLENVQTIYTGKHPLVYADWLHAARGAPTVLIYAHYDVQPGEPLEAWSFPPFEPYIENGFFYGRGVDDDKPGALLTIQAVEAYLQTSKTLPVNVKFLIEGQEEIGSPQLSAVLAKHAALFKCDYVFSADGGQIKEDLPGITLSLRGAVAFEVVLTALSTDVHSGLYGGSVRNAARTAAQLIASFHFPNNTIAVEGFYDDVDVATAENRADIAAFPFNETDFFTSVGASGPFGEEGYPTLERLWHRPSLDVIGAYSGYTGEGVKTIIPAKAVVKVSSRLVAGQRPRDIVAKIQAHVLRTVPPDVKASFRELGFSAAPYYMPKDTPGNRAATKILEEVMGRPPVWLRNGATIPALAMFEEHLGVKTTMFAFGLPDHFIHSPHERFRLSMYNKGREAYVRLFDEVSHVTGTEVKEEL